MLCENCGKKNSTSIYLPPNQNKIKYLCGQCYKKLNSSASLEDLADEVTSTLQKDQVCNVCGMAYKEFESIGQFGCANCYKVFRKYVDSKILSMFNEKKYLGKKPNLYYIEKEIKNLEELIEMMLKNGDYQKATKYGVELKRLKEENYDRL